MSQGQKVCVSFWNYVLFVEVVVKVEKDMFYCQIVDDGICVQDQYILFVDVQDQYDWIVIVMNCVCFVIELKLKSGLLFFVMVGLIVLFVGLFGIVMGILNVLVKIGVLGQVLIDMVVGLVGEVLYMIVIGLGVVVFVVFVYNWFQVCNKQILEELVVFLNNVQVWLLLNGVVKFIIVCVVVKVLVKFVVVFVKV